MKKILLFTVLLASILTVGVTAEDLSQYFTDPTQAEDMWFTIFTQYTFKAGEDMSETETNLLVNAFIAGMAYAAEKAGDTDRLCVAFMYNNNTAMAFICQHADYKRFAAGEIDANAFMELVVVQNLEL